MFLLVGWLILVVGTMVAGEHRASLGDFDSAVRSGRVQEVDVVGAMRATGWTGYVTVELRWRDGLMRQVSEITQVSEAQGAQAAPGTASSRVAVGDVGAYLAKAYPGLRVRDGGASTASMRWGGPLGTWVPAWITLGALALVLAAIMMAGWSDEPWRATRWGWFWLLFSPFGFFVVPLFALFSGPTPAFSRRPGARLRGGWAFLLSVVLGGLWQSAG